MELAIYIGLFLGSSIVIWFSIQKIVEKILHKSSDSNYASKRWYWVIFFGIICLSFVSTYFLFEHINYYPPVFVPIESSEEQERIKVESLQEEIFLLNQTLDNIENLTLSEIQSVLERVRALVVETKEETENNIKIITQLENKIHAEEIIAEKLNSLTKEQVELIKILIINDLKEENESSFWLGVVISFPVGVLASIMASILLKLYFKE